MAVVTEIICLNDDGSLNFGNYAVKVKQKSDEFEVSGDIYKVKTHNEITRMEKNGKLLIETVPGAAVHNFKLREQECVFKIEGIENTSVTMELEPEREYRIFIDGANVGEAKTNKSGKLNFSAELNEQLKDIRIERV